MGGLEDAFWLSDDAAASSRKRARGRTDHHQKLLFFFFFFSLSLSLSFLVSLPRSIGLTIDKTTQTK